MPDGRRERAARVTGARRRERMQGCAWIAVLAAGGALLACSDSGPGPASLSEGADASADGTLDGPQTTATRQDGTVDAPDDGAQRAEDANADVTVADVAEDATGDVADGADGAEEARDASPEADASPDDASPEADADGAPDALDAADTSPSPDGDAADGQAVTTQSVLESMGADCWTCAQGSGCLDPTIGGSTCEATTGVATNGPAAGASRASLCLAALQCDLGTGCASSGDATSCYCGDAGCADGAPPAGPCIAQEQGGLESTSEPAIVTLLQAPGDSPLGGVAGNAIAECLAVSCVQCFP